MLCIYICFIVTIAGNGDTASCVYNANLVEKTLPAEGGNLFPRFQLFLISFLWNTYACLSLSKTFSVLNGKFSLSNAAFVGGIAQYNNANLPPNGWLFPLLK